MAFQDSPHGPEIAPLIFAVISLASSSVKLPVIWALPPGISDRITGAWYTWPSNTIASRWFKCSRVTAAKSSLPSGLNSTSISGAPVDEFCLTEAERRAV